MEYPHLLYAYSLAADERSESKALHSVLQRTPSTTPMAPPTDRQKGFYTRDSVPSGCERVGNHTRCTEGSAPAVSVKARSVPYTNSNDNDNGNHNLAQPKASAVPYGHFITTIPLHDAMPAIGSCTRSTDIDRTCGSPSVAVGFFVLFPLSMVLLSLAVWLILRKNNKLRDEERAIETRPRLGQYQSASKLRLKAKVRCTSRPSKVVQSSKEKSADDVYERYSAYWEPYVPGWRAARIREEKDSLAGLPAKELPRGADAPTSSATMADTLDYYP